MNNEVTTFQDWINKRKQKQSFSKNPTNIYKQNMYNTYKIYIKEMIVKHL